MKRQKRKQNYMFPFFFINYIFFIHPHHLHVELDSYTVVTPFINPYTGGEVVRDAGCLTKGPGIESRVKYGC